LTQGFVYGNRGNGQTYGWTLDNTSAARDRNSALAWSPGDPAFFDGVFRTTVEGVLTVNGSPSSAARWVEGTSVVTVSDGRLTLRSGSGAVNNKLCFVKIWPQ
jgi:hypothetical protein